MSRILYVQMLNQELRNQPDYHEGIVDFSLAPSGGGFIWPEDQVNNHIYSRAYHAVEEAVRLAE